MQYSPTNLQQLREQAVKFHQSGNLAEAERLYGELIVAEPGDFSPLYLLSIVRAQQKRYPEALELIGAALKINPTVGEALLNYANILVTVGRFGEAQTAFENLLAREPGNAAAWNGHGNALQGLERLADALASYDRALALKQDFAEPLYNRSNSLLELKRFAEAVASYDRVVTQRPQFAQAWYWRGNALRALQRGEEALESYGRALAIDPGHRAALNNRGGVLQQLRRNEEALACFDRLAALDPADAETWNNRGIILQALERFGESLASYDRALAIAPDTVVVLDNRGKVLLELDRIDEAMTEFARAALLAHDKGASNPGDPPHKLQHDREQAGYLGGADSGQFRVEGGARLAGPAINPANSARVTQEWRTNRPQVVVIDDLLTPEALAGLRRFCLGSTIWRKSYAEGYLGAIPEFGFACPLLAQIAQEFRSAFPAIFQAHTLRYLWGFKYDSSLSGIRVHADEAAVNVNFWITPDEANRDPASGGLTVWDIAAPLDWDFARFNGDPDGTRQFLEERGAKAVTVPYRANRAVIFDSDLFHETDRFSFRDGYENRRINITLLYGRRERG